MAENSGYTVGQAYVQILPETTKFGSTLKNSIDTDLTEAGKKSGESYSSGISATIGKASAAIASAMAAGISALTAASVSAYGDYEQLVGGVETLFKDSSDVVEEYAANAYKTAGLSANEYMDQTIKFSASLLQSLDGDTAKAAEYADLAITDMADNANKMGTNITDIQNAYQGFAKQNYTMLDNLRLGYGGTKSEMERLIEDAEKLDSTFVASRDTNGDLAMSYADIVDAIHIVQTDMGFTGTTVKEAASTIQGSFASMKAAAQNLVAGLGDSNADVSALVEDLLNTVETAADNVMPVMETVFNNIADNLPSVMNSALSLLTELVTGMLPSLISSLTSVVKSVAQSLPDIMSAITDVLPDVLSDLMASTVDIVATLIPSLAESIGELLLNLPSMLISAVDGLISGVVGLFSQSAEDKIEDDIWNGTQDRLTSSWAQMLEDADTNMREAWANLIGNEEWAQAEANIQLNLQLIDDFDEKYKSWKEDVAETTVEAEVKQANLLANLELLVGGLDGDGKISAEEYDYAQKIADEINQYLPEDGQITLDPVYSDIEMILDAVGKNTSTEDIIAKVKETHPDWYDGSLPIDTLVQMNIECNKAGIEGVDNITEWIRKNGARFGLTDAEIEAACNLLVKEPGMVTAWYSTEGGSLKAYLEQELGFTDSETLDAEIGLIIGAAENGDDIDTIIQKLKDNFGEENAAKWTTEIVYEIVNEGDLTLDEMAEQINQVIEAELKQSLLEIDMQAITDAYASLKESVDSTKETQDAFNESVVSGNYSAANAQLQELTSAYELQSGYLEGLTDYYEDYYMNMGYTAEEAAVMTQEILNGDSALANQKAKVDEIRNSLIDYANQLVTANGGVVAMNEGLLATATSMAGYSSSLSEFQTTLGLTDQQMTALSEAVRTLGGDATTSAGDWQYMIEGFFNAETQTNSVAAALSDAGIEAYDAGLIMEALAQVMEFTGSSTETMSAAMEEAASDTESAATSIGESSSKIGTGVEEGFSKAQGAADSYDPSGAADAQQETSDSIVESAQIGDELNEESLNNMASLVAGISASMQDVYTAFDGVRLKAVGVLGTDSALHTYLSSRGATMMSWLGTSITDGLTHIESAMNTIANSIRSAVSRLSGIMASYGAYAGQGLANGLYGQWSNVYSAARSLAQAASAGATITLRIHSPSKVFEEYGQYVSEGLALGISEGTQEAVDATKQLANETVNAALIGADAINEISGNTADVTAQIINDDKDDGLTDMLTALLNAVNKLGNMQMVTDTGVLAGELANAMNNELGAIRLRERRG